MIVWIDDTLGIEVVGVASGKGNLPHQLTANWEEAERFAYKAGFPKHGLVVRSHHQDDLRIRKGITDWGKRCARRHWACSAADSGCACLETDVRAHMNPTRMEIIAEATQGLVHKLCSLCPICNTPGLQITERVLGLPCENCGIPTREALADIYHCVRCDYQVKTACPEKKAQAGHCEFCNP